MTISAICDALHDLAPNAEWSIGGEQVYKNIIWHKGNGHEKPSESAVNAKITEIENAQPMVELRRQRDAKLALTDWVVTKANETGGAVANNWKTYRQALRDLPASASPQLDSDGNLTNVTWPTEPN
tara:strand:- start:158 stop:535 length:378 start_codon:yes stop_codon:yes gene_type:complete